MQHRAAVEPLLFADEDFVWDDVSWEEAAAGPVETPPAASRPARPSRRRQTRTFAGDLARLREGVGSRLAALPTAALLAGLASLLVVLVAVTVIGRGGGTESPERAAPEAQAPAAGGRAPAAPVDLLSGPPLRHGDRGAGVRGVQAALVSLGLYTGLPDADYGDGTAAAVASFQSDQGLVADAVLGASTAEALARALDEYAGSEAAAAGRGLDEAVRANRLPVAEARSYRSILAAAQEELERLPLDARGYLAIVLGHVSAHAADYDRPRALALFRMLEENRRRLASGPLPQRPRDVVGEDGVVYRFFPAHGFQVHPLASFARLNGLAKSGRRAETDLLAKALVVRAVPTSGTLTWEYYFPFGGPPRWTSGLAQGVGAQALARAGVRLDDRGLLDAARRAFRAVPASLSRSLAGGIWIREYSYSDMAILNAQLQTLVSLGEYAKITGDAEGRAVVEDLAHASRALLSSFDTGCWSLYALDGNNATPGYHSYHISLLNKLGEQTGESLWLTTAERWAAFRQAHPGGVAGACA